LLGGFLRSNSGSCIFFFSASVKKIGLAPCFTAPGFTGLFNASFFIASKSSTNLFAACFSAGFN